MSMCSIPEALVLHRGVTKTTKAIAEYMVREYTEAGEIHTGLLDMVLPSLTTPESNCD